MYVKGFAINHQLCHLGQIFRNFPVYIITGKCGNRLAKLGFDHHDPGFAEIILIFIQITGNGSIICDACAAALNSFLYKIHLRIQTILHKDAGISTAFDFLAVYRDGDHRRKIIALDSLSCIIIADGFNLISCYADLFPGSFQCLIAIVVVGIYGVAVSHQGTMQFIDHGIQAAYRAATGTQGKA